MNSKIWNISYINKITISLKKQVLHLYQGSIPKRRNGQDYDLPNYVATRWPKSGSPSASPHPG